MSYKLAADVDDRPIAIDGAGTLGRRIASVYAAGGPKTLGVSAARTGRVEVFDDLREAVRGAWMVIEAVSERVSG
jgi:3-hydroxybutyryl-CoA dehydrogenase